MDCSNFGMSKAADLQVYFGIRRGFVRHAVPVQSFPGGKKATFCRYYLSKTEKADRALDIDIDRFKTAPYRIEFVPEAGPPSVLQKLLPPFAVWVCPCEAFERFKIAPILAHPDMQRKERVEYILVKKQSIGSSGDRSLN